MPEGGQHWPKGREGKLRATHLSQKSHPTSKISPCPARRAELSAGTAARSSSEGSPGRSPALPEVPRGPRWGRRRGRRPRRAPQAEAQVPSSGLRGPAGHTDVPTSRAASLVLLTASAGAASTPRSPLLRRACLWPPFPSSCVSPLPLLHVPPFRRCHVSLFFHARTFLLSIPPGLGHLRPGPSQRTVRHTPRAGDSKASEGLVSSQAHKAGRWLCDGTTSPVQTPACLCCPLHALSPSDFPKVGLAASLAWGLQREPAAGCGGSHQQLPKDGFGGTSSVVRATRGLQEPI